MKNPLKVQGMSRLAKLGLLVGGLGVAGVMAAGPSFASTPSSGATVISTNSPSATAGKGTQTIQYKTTYTDPVMGPVTCAGVHQVNKNTSANGQDSFTCTSTSGHPLTIVTAGQPLPNFGWISDYFSGQTPSSTVYASSLTGTVSPDGMSYTAVATYPAS
jgi:hypothetical protein